MLFNRNSVNSLVQPVLERVRKFLGTVLELGKPARILLVAATSIFALVALFWVVDKLVLYYLAQTYVDQVVRVFDLNDHLKTALLVATFAAAAIFAKYVWSFSKKRRMVGIAGIAAMLIGHSVALWYGTKDKYFDTSGNSIRCYVLTRDGNVIYGEHSGIDPATGRPCRPITPEMLERLKQYEAGKRPQRIVTVADADPIFFDPRSGEPIVWYSVAKDHVISLFDLMGFNLETGDELIPISPDVAEAWKKQEGERRRHVPKLISDPEKYVFFDPRNGEARTWYWLSTDGRYEFYDSPGFRPQTGDELRIVTREVHARWEETEKSPKTPVKAPGRVQISKDTVFFDPITGSPLLWYWRRDKGNYEFFDAPGFHPQNGEPLKSFTKDTQTQYQQEQAERAEELQRASLAARQCDELAANPGDARRVGEGAAYADLKPRAVDAAAACELAANQNPNELRFKYQLARALELTGDGAVRMKNRQRAFDIHQSLVRAGYPAAFDNLGSLYRWDKKDLASAAALFRRGASLSDSDSMVSLAELIESGQVMPQSPNEAPLQLYKRAADLGNENAARAYQSELAKAQEMQQQRVLQLQQQQRMMQIMGGILRNIH
jgi:hypothetical protein